MEKQTFEDRLMELLAQEEGGDENQLWWLSFVNPSGPVKDRFLGVIVTKAKGAMHAQQHTWALGINPGGEIMAVKVDGIPEEYQDRLLSRTEIEEAGF